MGNYIYTKKQETIDILREKLIQIEPTAANIPIKQGKDYVDNKSIIYINIENNLSFERLMYKLLHLYSLTQCSELGHTPSFWIKFEELLEQARILKIDVDDHIGL
jgi:hypothetical protein